MKILFVTSYYSALQKSIEEDRWHPVGMPAITKLFEGLKKRDIYFEPFFVQRNAAKDEFYRLKNTTFNVNVSIIKITKKIDIKYIRPFGRSYNSILLYRKIKKSCKDYDLIYVDRANLIVGAFFAFSGKRVVLRLHGVTDFYETFSRLIYKIMNPLKLLCLRAPFKYIICSEDGSPGKEFLQKYTRADRSVILLNGVDKHLKDKPLSRIKNDHLMPGGMSCFLFLSRLSKDKGIIDFIKVINEIQKNRKDFYVIIVGDGECRREVEEMIERYALENILLTGSVSHSNVYDYYLLSDVYISLNKLGNLSNTVLEAVNSVKCIITLGKSKKPLKHVSTYEFFGDSALYVDRDNIEESLFKVINCILDAPELLATKKKELERCKSKLMSWDERIEEEIILLESIRS